MMASSWHRFRACAIPSPRQLRRMTNAALLTWCLRDTWARLGGRGACPWTGERDFPVHVPEALSDHEMWERERGRVLREFTPYKMGRRLDLYGTVNRGLHFPQRGTLGGGN